jgi:hypothetical protein
MFTTFCADESYENPMVVAVTAEKKVASVEKVCKYDTSSDWTP